MPADSRSQLMSEEPLLRLMKLLNEEPRDTWRSTTRTLSAFSLLLLLLDRQNHGILEG